jgi:hypothetical protein
MCRWGEAIFLLLPSLSQSAGCCVIATCVEQCEMCACVCACVNSSWYCNLKKANSCDTEFSTCDCRHAARRTSSRSADWFLDLSACRCSWHYSHVNSNSVAAWLNSSLTKRPTYLSYVWTSCWMRDFRLLPQCKWDRRHSAMFTQHTYIFTDVSW